MALIKCPECGKEISDQAGKCPNCGAPIDNPNLKNYQKNSKTNIGIMLGAIAFFLICLCVSIYAFSNKKPEGVAPAEVKQVVNDNSDSDTHKETPDVTDDFADVETVYELSAGFYTAGIDLPSGRCNVTAVSGTGNLISSNMFNGGVNEMFGVDDGTGIFSGSFNGLKLPEGTLLSTNGRLVIKIEYTSIEGRAKGRIYDEEAAVTIGSGNYVSGSDFPAGVYRIKAISGSGNLISSNAFDGGVNEMFGIDDGYGIFNDQIMNVDLPDGTELTVSGGLEIEMVPCK